jgi:hypothetical protein
MHLQRCVGAGGAGDNGGGSGGAGDDCRSKVYVTVEV